MQSEPNFPFNFTSKSILHSLFHLKVAAILLLYSTYAASTVFTNVEMSTTVTERAKEMKEKVLNRSFLCY